MNRRDFLQQRSLPPTDPPFAGGDSLPRPGTGEVCLLKFCRAAMATQFEWLFPWGTPHADQIADQLFNQLDRLEAQLTAYRASSEISRLNRLASLAPVPLEPRLFELLQDAGRIARETEGAFDITSGPLIKAWGFYRREGRLPSEEELAAARELVGMGHVEFLTERRAVRYRRRGLEINLGSIGKGYALDQLALQLRERHGLDCALLNGGNSSVLAVGTPPGMPEGWTVGLRHPENPDRRLAQIRLRGRAMATSGATYQHFRYNGRKLGHLLDPRTGWPAEGMASATAVAPTAAQADAYATAFFVLGIEGTRRVCAEHPHIGAVLLPDRPGAALEVFNLPPGDVAPAAVAEIGTADSSWDLA